MRLSPHIFAVILLLVPHGVLAKDAVTAAAPASTQAQASNKGAIGALAQDVDCQLAHPATGHTMAHAVLIVDVETDGPAYKRGLRTGDYLIGVNGSAVSQCSEIAPILAKIPADGMIRLELLRAGQVVTIEAPRQNYSEQKPELDSKAAAEKASEIVAKNQETRPVQLSDEQRAVIAAYTRNIKAQLAAAPEGTDARAIIKDMQNIRNVFRDSDSTRDGWMTGKAGAATMQFKKGNYVLILKGMNNELFLEVYRADGVLVHSAQMDTVQQRRQIPSLILKLLQAM